MKTKKTNPPSTSKPGSLIDITGRAIPNPVKLRLYVEAGGRCEFDGCNEYLLEHRLTLKGGNFGQMAHIVAFRPDGPRGQSKKRPLNINDIANLMLLCPSCHKVIDDHPSTYSRDTLEEYKKNHESRIRHLTSLGPQGKTSVLVLTAPINGHRGSLPFDHIIEATAPRYPTNRNPEVIDLTAISDRNSAFIQTSRSTILDTLNHFFGPNGDAQHTGHVSIFALAPIPLLIFLGRQLSNKVPTDLFQRHRDTERWTWKHKGPPVLYIFKKLKRGTARNKVALILSLSGTIRIRDIPENIRRTATIYTITLAKQVPRPTFLRTRQDLEGFRIVFQEALGAISHHHGLLKSIDLFPAVPPPIAVLCGRELLPKTHPSLRVWDYDKANNGFTFQLEVK